MRKRDFLYEKHLTCHQHSCQSSSFHISKQSPVLCRHQVKNSPCHFLHMGPVETLEAIERGRTALFLERHSQLANSNPLYRSKQKSLGKFFGNGLFRRGGNIHVDWRKRKRSARVTSLASLVSIASVASTRIYFLSPNPPPNGRV